MTLPVKLVCDENGGSTPIITVNGELVVAPFSTNISIHNKMDTVDIAYNFTEARAGKTMILQNILVYANRNVGVNDATICIYMADSPTSTTIVSEVLEFELPQKNSRDMIGLNLALPEGLFLNAKTNDNDVFLTMMGYYK